MSGNKYITTESALGIIYFKKNIFVPKEELERRVGRKVQEMGYEELKENIFQMLHDGDRRRVFFDTTISEEAYSKINGFSIEQFIHLNAPGFWVEM